MDKGHTASALRQLRTLFSAGTSAGLTDGQLLRRFAARRVEVAEAEVAAEAAFAALVDRHGPMVWGVCRRILGDRHDAEDAFQATFLLLVRKAGSVRVDGSLGGWLHGVARRVAGRALAEARRRRSIPGQAPTGTGPDPVRQAELGDLRAALEAELGRLPTKYRDPVELCHLQGLTHEEAARRIGCPVRTVRSRLAHGRRRLRVRLGRRGFAPVAAGLAAALPGAGRAAVVPPALLRSTVRSAVRAAAGGPGAFPASVAALAKGAMRAMILGKLKLGTVAAALGLAATGAGALAYQRPGPEVAPGEAAGPPSSDDRPDLPGEAPALRRSARPHLPEVEELARAIEGLRDPGQIAEALEAVRHLTEQVKMQRGEQEGTRRPRPEPEEPRATARPGRPGSAGGRARAGSPSPSRPAPGAGSSADTLRPAGGLAPDAATGERSPFQPQPDGRPDDPFAGNLRPGDPTRRSSAATGEPPHYQAYTLSTASLEDQDRRIRRLEALLEELLRERGRSADEPGSSSVPRLR